MFKQNPIPVMQPLQILSLVGITSLGASWDFHAKTKRLVPSSTKSINLFEPKTLKVFAKYTSKFQYSKIISTASERNQPYSRWLLVRKPITLDDSIAFQRRCSYKGLRKCPPSSSKPIHVRFMYLPNCSTLMGSTSCCSKKIFLRAIL